MIFFVYQDNKLFLEEVHERRMTTCLILYFYLDLYKKLSYLCVFFRKQYKKYGKLV